MKLLATTLLSLYLLLWTRAKSSEARTASGSQLPAASTSDAKSITGTHSASRVPNKGSDKYFTGSVRVESLFEAKYPSHATGGSVMFEPGARSAWHTHPLGQILIITAGIGYVQKWGGPGSRPVRNTGMEPPQLAEMTHIAIQDS